MKPLNILTVLQISPQCPSEKKKLYGMLAFRQIERAAQATEQVRHNEYIHTELMLIDVIGRLKTKSLCQPAASRQKRKFCCCMMFLKSMVPQKTTKNCSPIPSSAHLCSLQRAARNPLSALRRNYKLSKVGNLYSIFVEPVCLQQMTRAKLPCWRRTGPFGASL